MIWRIPENNIPTCSCVGADGIWPRTVTEEMSTEQVNPDDLHRVLLGTGMTTFVGGVMGRIHEGLKNREGQLS